MSNIPEYKALLCKKCQTETLHVARERSDTVHEAAWHCEACGTFWGWKKKQKNEGKRPANKHSPESLGIDYCQLCRRHKSRLGHHESLIPHHIIEIQEGGEDVPENIWVVCLPCHILIHHQRVYLRDHMVPMWEKYESIKGLLAEANLQPEAHAEIIRKLLDHLGL